MPANLRLVPRPAPEPMVTRAGLFDMQVCVPSDWTDEQVLVYAENSCPRWSRTGWVIHKEGDKHLLGAAERVPCEDPARAGKCVHIMLDA